MLLLILAVLLSHTVAYDECLVPPLAVGPECKSSQEYTGTSYRSAVTYTIESIEVPFNDGGTNIHCWGFGGQLNKDGCPTKEKFDFVDLGIMGEGASWDVHWGQSAGIPTIKCSGEPLPAKVTWSWKGKQGMPGESNKACCAGIPYGSEAVCCSWHDGIIPGNFDGPLCPARHLPGLYDACCGAGCCDEPYRCCYGDNGVLGCYNPATEACCYNRICSSSEHCCESGDSGFCCPDGTRCNKCGAFF
jgi:hypothetical protein